MNKQERRDWLTSIGLTVLSLMLAVALCIAVNWEKHGFTRAELSAALTRTELPTPAQDPFAVPFGVDRNVRVRLAPRGDRMTATIVNPGSATRTIWLNSYEVKYRCLEAPPPSGCEPQAPPLCLDLQFSESALGYELEPGDEQTLEVRRVKRRPQYEVVAVIGERDREWWYPDADDELLLAEPPYRRGL